MKNCLETNDTHTLCVTGDSYRMHGTRNTQRSFSHGSRTDCLAQELFKSAWQEGVVTKGLANGTFERFLAHLIHADSLHR